MSKLAVEDAVETVIELGTEKPIRVLLVDDDTSFLNVAKKCLEALGNLQIGSASSVRQAEKKLRDEDLDAIVSDYKMPEKDGLSFLKELRQKGNTIPFIVFTGKGKEEIAIAALNYGADRYLNKNGDPQTVFTELAHSIRQTVQRRRTEEKLRDSEEKYRNLFELAPDAIVTLDMKGVVTSCNAVTMARMGYSENRIVGKHFSKLEFLASDDAPKYENLFTSITAGEVPEPFEVTWQHKDGTQFASELHVGLIKKDSQTTGLQVIVRDINERKRAEEILRDSEERFRSIADNSHDGLFIMDDNFHIVYANDEAEGVVGRPRKEIVGQDFRKFLDGKNGTLAVDRYVRRQKGEKVPSRYRFWMTRADGEKRELEVRSSILRTGQGRVYTVGHVLDVTEQTKTEERLRKEKEKFEAFFNVMADPVVIVNAKGKILAISNKAVEITGYGKEELEGRNFMRTPVVTAKSKAVLIKNLIKRMMGKQIAPYEVEVVTKDRRKLPYEINATKIEYDGKPADLVVFRSLEERKRAEKSIVENREKFEGLFRGNPEAAVYVGGDFRILDINPMFTRLFGYSLDEVKGKKLLNLIVPEEKVEEATLLDREAESGYVYKSHTVRKKKDGTSFPVSISAAPITTEGRLIGHVGLYRDITEMKRTEQAVRETMIKLATMNEKLRVVGRLTRHDVRNKLAAISGNVYLARKYLTGNHESLEYLEGIELALRQTDDIFNFARYYEMLGLEELAYLDVEKCLQEAFQLLPDLEDIKVVKNCDGLMVLADSLFRQLLVNLIDNSLRHGKKVTQISVYYEANDKDVLRLIYEDDGVGIHDDEKKKIFMEGYGKSTGYGLYLIEKICEVYGWTIRETGEYGKGVRFTITIPATKQDGRMPYKLSQPTQKQARNSHF